MKGNKKHYESWKQHLENLLPEYLKFKKIKVIYFIMFYIKLYEEVEIHDKFSNSNFYITN